MSQKILATVNNMEITEEDLQNALARVPANQRSYYAGEQGKKQLLEQMISFELIYNDAKDNGEENEETFIKELDKVKKDVLIQYSIQKILNGLSINQDEVKKFYEDNKSQFKDPETVEAKHILVDSEDEARKIAQEIKDGLTFEDAAKKYSKCPSKEQGGNLGKFGRGQMVPEFEEKAFQLEIGVVSEPVKTQFGYHLIKVISKNEASIKKFDEVKDLIKGRLLQEKQSEKYIGKVNELKKKYKVELAK